MSAQLLPALQYQYFMSAADPNLLDHYYEGLNRTLKKFNVDQVILSTATRRSSEDTYIILAKNSSYTTIGGIRIELKSAQNSLPIEKCETPYQKNIAAKINKLIDQNRTVAELSGLWVDSEAKKLTGLGALGPGLCLEATQLALGLGVDVIVALPPKHTFNYFKNLGYVAPSDIPTMAYPDDRYLSTFTWYFNPTSFNLTLSKDQEQEI
ncbi:MAG: hypothetical protein ACXVAX_02840 [Pseudobdellovibrio sp.]